MLPKIPSIAAVGLDQTNVRPRWLIPAILIGGALLYLSQREFHPPVVRESLRPPTFYVSEATSFGLNAARQGDDLLLVWNRDAPAIRAAVTGMLVIQTGNNQQEFILTSEDLHTGKFTYRATANQLDIRLHVFDVNDKQTNDSAVLSLAPEPVRHAPASRRPAAHSAGTAQRSSATVRRQPGPVPPARVGEVSDVTAARLGEPPRTNSGLPTPPLLNHLPSFLSPAVVSGSPEQSAHTESPPGGAGSLPVVGEALDVTPVRRIVTAIPLVKKLLHHPDFVPPTPSLSPLPKIPDNLRPGLTREVSIDVKVFVDAGGDVKYAELLTNGMGSDREIASLAVFESRHWKFHPALMRGKPRDAEVILHFRFGPQ